MQAAYQKESVPFPSRSRVNRLPNECTAAGFPRILPSPCHRESVIDRRVPLPWSGLLLHAACPWMSENQSHRGIRVETDVGQSERHRLDPNLKL